jgi:hypothetical protein
MTNEEIEKIIESWKNHLATGGMEDYKLEIEDNVPKEFAAIALYLDSKTVKASGANENYYEGYRQASIDVLNVIGVQMAQDDQTRIITLFRKESDDAKQEELKKHIWG